MWIGLRFKQAQEARDQEITNFSFKMFKIIRFSRSTKCSKTIVTLTFTTQKANACSLLDSLFCSVVSSLGKVGPKIQGASLRWNLLLRLIQICRIPWWFHFFFFWPEIPFLGKFGQLNQNCQFELKFGSKTNSNMQNSMMIFSFSAFSHKYSSWANLFQKSKINCSKWSLLQSLIGICGIKWWCPFYLFYTRNTLFGLPFLGKFGPNIKIVSLSLQLVQRLIRICKI